MQRSNKTTITKILGFLLQPVGQLPYLLVENSVLKGVALGFGFSFIYPFKRQYLAPTWEIGNIINSSIT